jgi:hypothetical protein
VACGDRYDADVIGHLVAIVGSEGGRGLDPNIVRPGWTALAVVAVLGVGLYVLARSFVKHARRAKDPWPGDEE